MNSKLDHTLSGLIKEREETKRKLDLLDELISKFSGEQIAVEGGKAKESAKNLPQGYDMSTSMKNKILYVLKSLNRFSHSTEIKRKLAEIEGRNPEDFKVSATLSALRRAGKIHKHQVGTQNRNAFWGSKKWINEDKTIKTGFEFNKSALPNNEEQNSLFEDF